MPDYIKSMEKIPSPLDVKRWIDQKIDSYWQELLEESPAWVFATLIFLLTVVIYFGYLTWKWYPER